MEEYKKTLIKRYLKACIETLEKSDKKDGVRYLDQGSFCLIHTLLLVVQDLNEDGLNG